MDKEAVVNPTSIFHVLVFCLLTSSLCICLYENEALKLSKDAKEYLPSLGQDAYVI